MVLCGTTESEIGPKAKAWFDAIGTHEAMLSAGSNVSKILSAVEKISYPMATPSSFRHDPNDPTLVVALATRDWVTPNTSNKRAGRPSASRTANHNLDEAGDNQVLIAADESTCVHSC
jgi:hypothetical protein